MNQKITVRCFKAEDMGRVMDLLQSVSQFIPDNNNLEELASNFIKNDDCYACVVVCDNRVIGFGSVFILKRIRGGAAAIIEDIVVDESFRRKGIGRLIINKLLAYTKEQGCFKVTLVATENNILFYKSLGFSEDLASMKLMF